MLTLMFDACEPKGRSVSGLYAPETTLWLVCILRFFIVFCLRETIKEEEQQQ